jgi:hypothetical protein
MNPTRYLRPIRRLAAVLAALAAILLTGATSAALAHPLPLPHAPPAPVPASTAPAPVHPPPLPPGWNKHPRLPGPAHAYPAPASGLPRWQITLIVAGAAVLAAVALLANPQAARRHPRRARHITRQPPRDREATLRSRG